MTDTTELSPDAARAALIWLVELGADEPIGEAPVNRYDPPEVVVAAPRAAPVTASAAVAAEPLPAVDPVAEARALASGAGTLAELAEVQAAYEHCEVKRGAKNFVFADGVPGARVMVIGEAPGREEDLEGRPFIGAAGQLLDKMFAAIGLSRQAADPERALYITNVLPWRPPHNRDPEPGEIAMMLPFLARHVELAAPEIIVLMGNTACAAALGRRGIGQMRGQWAEAFGRPAMPMTHPAYLMRTPAAKREAWADLLAIKARLEGGA